MIWMNGWLWILAALVIALIELFLPVWVFLGIAIAVLIMGVAILLGLWSGSLPLALIVTALLSGVVWLFLRRIMGTTHGQVRVWKTGINDDHPPRRKP